MAKQGTKPTHTVIRLAWRLHQDGRVRVWRDDWFSDQFEILSPNEFDALQTICRRFSIIIQRAADDE